MLLNINLTRLLALAAMISLLLAGLSQAAEKTNVPAAAGLADIQVSFLMDPRLTRGMYMGERWVSPPTYTRVQEGKKPLIVEAMAEGMDAEGNPVKVSPAWKAGNPDLVQVSPAQGGKVKLNILKEGQSDLTVTYGGISKKFTVQAGSQFGGMRVDISR